MAPLPEAWLVLPIVVHPVPRLALGALSAVVLSSVATPVAAAPSAAGEQVAELARQYAGSPYVWGGSSPAGFDFTGFVMFVYAQFGIDLPHNEAGQLASGPAVGADDLQPGDVLVFANTYRRGLSHVGIYLGDGHFVHAVDERVGVTVSDLADGYWSSRFVGASRAFAA
jgi:cell wall-associated NlpC family hydrolase